MYCVYIIQVLCQIFNLLIYNDLMKNSQKRKRKCVEIQQIGWLEKSWNAALLVCMLLILNNVLKINR